MAEEPRKDVYLYFLETAATQLDKAIRGNHEIGFSSLYSKFESIRQKFKNSYPVDSSREILEAESELIRLSVDYELGVWKKHVTLNPSPQGA